MMEIIYYYYYYLFFYFRFNESSLHYIFVQINWNDYIKWGASAAFPSSNRLISPAKTTAGEFSFQFIVQTFFITFIQCVVVFQII